MAFMANAIPNFPKPENSPFVSFAKGTKERELLEKEIAYLRHPALTPPTLPLWINGPIKKNETRPCIVPHDHQRLLGHYSVASEEDVHNAIKTVLGARDKWMQLPWFWRLNIFRKAAELLEKKHLYEMVAAVMEDYSKNPFEAFIDVQELIDFWRFNAWYAYELYKNQPDSDNGSFNMLDYRPLEGFVFAIPPNNFVAIEGNLPTAPLIMGNVVIVKPSSDVVYSFHVVLRILLKAGLPKNVLAVLQGDSSVIGEIVLNHKMLAGVHFTGGTDTFKAIRWQVAQNEYNGLYKNFVRIVGETGGKDPIIVYDDHDPVQTAAGIVVGGFGAQGRKCSATSRVYITPKMWQIDVKPHLYKFMDQIRVGDVADFKNYMGAIINEREFKKIVGYIERARHAEKYDKTNFEFPVQKHGVEEIYGGEHKGEQIANNNGYFIRPMVIVTRHYPDGIYETMVEEIFGPVVTICLLPKESFENGKVLKICDKTSDYALTGAIQTNDIYQFCEALEDLKDNCGNIYDWKTTGAMVNRQPFSGARMSGTNSKVGWWLNLLNWTSPRTIGMTFVKPNHFAPSYLDRE